MVEGVIGYRLTNFGNIASESSRVGYDYQYVIETFVLIVGHSSPYVVLSTTGVIALTCNRVSMLGGVNWCNYELVVFQFRSVIIFTEKKTKEIRD